MGYQAQDPNFYQTRGNYQKKVVVWCALVMVLGSLMQGLAVISFYYNKSLDTRSADKDIIMTAGANAMEWRVLDRRTVSNQDLQTHSIDHVQK